MPGIYPTRNTSASTDSRDNEPDPTWAPLVVYLIARCNKLRTQDK